MNRFSEQLLEAFEVAMDEKLSKLQYDKTIQATITSIEDIDKGEYKVKYQEGIITVYAKDPTESFKVGDIVYVIIPQSDFTGKKFISHKVTSKTLSTGQYSDLSETIIEVSPDLSKLGFSYTSIGPWGLIAGTGKNSSGQEIDTSEPNIDHIIISESQQLSNEFNTYLNKYEYLQIKAEFMTTFDKDHITGDYGIELGFRTAPTENNVDGQLIPYFLNISNFVGDPYHLWAWTPQSIIIKIPKENLYSLAGISFYEKGFDSTVGEQNKNPNIFMRDLQISFIEKVDLTNTPYYLTIFPVKGVLFTNSLSSLVLNAKVINYGQEIDSKYCIYKWFKRDLTVTEDNENYSKQAGWGWKPVVESSREKGTETASLTVASSAVSWQQSYKLVVIYNTSVVMTQEITLYKENYNINIEQITQINTIKLKLSDSRYKGLWYYLNINGRYQAISNTKLNTIDITSYLYYSPMVFYCQVYNNTTYLGELTYAMRGMESKEDVSVVFIGESIFNYDANGDIGLEYSQIEQTLIPEVVFNNGIISSSVKIEWLDFNGNVISETGDEYNPSGSMIESVRVDKNTNSLQYKIKKDFEEVPSKKNNTFKLRITTLDAQVYIFEKEIIFIKVGDPGTNGTGYQSIIRIIDNNYFVATTNNASGPSVKLQCDVYRGSQQLGSEDCTIKWEGFHLTLEESNIFGVVTVKANDSNNYRYVKATIKIKNASESTTLYNFYGVDSITNITNFNNTTDKAEFLLGISKLPYAIQYQASGLNPSCRKQVPTINKTTIASSKISLLDIQGEFFVPAKEFNPADKIALLSLTHTSPSFTVYHPVPMYINTFGNEAINGWDGVQLDLGDDANSHVFAPQVGAGTKNSTTNKFTGVVMGKDSSQDKIGLYGYKDGISTFGLREDGTAYFGASGLGRIDIDGTSATISGGGGGNSDNGMTITLANTELNNDAIKIGNGNFKVTYAGILTANNAVINGNIKASSGSVGGWTLNSNNLYSGTASNAVYISTNAQRPAQFTLPKGASYWAYLAGDANADDRLGTLYTATDDTSYDVYYTFSQNDIVYIRFYNGSIQYCVKLEDVNVTSYYRIWAGYTNPYNSSANFKLTSKGVLTVKSAIVTGTINADKGYIGGASGWIINTNKIYSVKNNKYVALSNQGNYAFYAGSSDTNDSGNSGNPAKAPFSITFDGALKATNATVSGTITAGSGSKIGGWNLTDTRLYSGSGTSQVALDSGTSSVNEAIWAGNSTSTSAPFRVTRKGALTATNATITGVINANTGYIGGTSGGWKIETNKISSAIDTSYCIEVDKEYFTNTELSTGKVVTTETIPVFNYKTYTGKDYVSFTLQNSDTILYTLKANIKAVTTKPYIGLSSQGNIAIWAGSTTSKDAPFRITQTGYLVATQATIQGKIIADSGKIGGWTIDNQQLYSGYVHLYGGKETTYESPNSTENKKDYYRIWAGSNSPSSAKFSITSRGILKATEATVQGDITATSGSIGNWIITNNAISTLNSESTATTNATTGMTKTGFTGYIQRDNKSYSTSEAEDKISRIAFWSGMKYVNEDSKYYLQGDSTGTFFAVTHSGQLYCRNAQIKNATIEGSITVGDGAQIGNWYIRDGILKNSSTGEATAYIGPTMVKLPGLTLSATGIASFTGDISTANITATGGRIGGWTINSGSLFSGNVSLNSSNGTISGATISGGNISIGNGNFIVNSSGTMTANGSLSLNSNDTSSSVVSISGSMNNINCTGTLKLGTGLSSTSQGNVTTYICQLHSTTGIKLEAAAGGISLKAAGGIYLQDGNGNSIIQMPEGQSYNVYIARTPENIYIKDDNNQNITLASYISSNGGGGGGTAVFG